MGKKMSKLDILKDTIQKYQAKLMQPELSLLAKESYNELLKDLRKRLKEGEQNGSEEIAD